MIEDRIRKLLRLSKSPNQHEAELALAMAIEIAAKHKVDLATLSLDDDTRRLIEDRVRMGERYSLSKSLAILTAQRFFNVRCIRADPVLCVIGTTSDVAIARHVIEFLRQSCDRSFADFKRPRLFKNLLKARRSYTAGFFYGITCVLERTKVNLLAQNNSLLPILATEERRRDAFAAAAHPNTVSVKLYRPASFTGNILMHGYMSGLSTRINPAIHTPDSRCLTQGAK